MAGFKWIIRTTSPSSRRVCLRDISRPRFPSFTRRDSKLRDRLRDGQQPWFPVPSGSPYHEGSAFSPMDSFPKINVLPTVWRWWTYAASYEGYFAATGRLLGVLWEY